MKWTAIVKLVLLAILVFSSGCQQWQQKYEQCDSAYKGLRADYDIVQDELIRCNAQRPQLENELSLANQQLAATQRQLDKAGKVFDSGKSEKGIVKMWTMRGNETFVPGSVKLQPAAKTLLDRIAGEIIGKYPDKQVSVVGHTDTDPIKSSEWKDNWELSSQRAMVVTRYLMSKGVAPEQLAATGRSEFDPAKTKQASRRVEIVVHVY